MSFPFFFTPCSHLINRLSGWVITLCGLAWGGSITCAAQTTCGGTLGVPSINQTFGTGTSGTVLPGRTTFDRKPYLCVADGEYTLADSVDGGCHGDAWHTVREDHTPGDVRGDMLVVNASYQPSEFYSQPLAGLCTGVTYEFSVWVLNLNLYRPPGACGLPTPRDPNLILRVETPGGVHIQALNSGAVPRTPTPTWVRFALLFTMPTNQDTVVVKLINDGLGGCGNDLLLDDIQFRPCHPTLQIRFSSASVPILPVCAYGTFSLLADLGAGYIDPIYQWQESTDSLTWRSIPGANQPNYTTKAAFFGQRYYRVLCTRAINAAALGRAECSAQSNLLSVVARPVSAIDLGRDTTLCEGRRLVLAIPKTTLPGTGFSWSDGNTGSNLTVGQAGVYWLESTLDGCTFRDSVVVAFRPCRLPQFYLPGAFTPNADGVNDRLVVFHDDYVSFELKIYNRWGIVVFTSNKPENEWDGTYEEQPCPADGYAWVIDYEAVDYTNQLVPFRKKGVVSLFR